MFKLDKKTEKKVDKDLRTIIEHTAEFLGSFKFIVILTLFLSAYIAWNNFAGGHYRFDPPPFLGLNLMLSILACYTAPIILLADKLKERRAEAKFRAREAGNSSQNEAILDAQRELHSKIDELFQKRGIDLHDNE